MSSKLESIDRIPFAPLPTQQEVVGLPLYHQLHHHHYNDPSYRRYFCQCISFSAFVFFIACVVFFLYPSKPAVHLSRIHLNHIGVNSSPKPTLYLSFSLLVKIHNTDYLSFDYDSIVVSVGYRGRELGFVRSNGGSVRARGTSFVEATLNIDGLEVIHDVLHLIADWTKGVIPFDTDTQVKGYLGLLFFHIPIKGKLSCEVYANTKNQTVDHQDCYPV